VLTSNVCELFSSFDSLIDHIIQYSNSIFLLLILNQDFAPLVFTCGMWSPMVVARMKTSVAVVLLEFIVSVMLQIRLLHVPGSLQA